MEMTDFTSATLAQKLAKKRLDKMRGVEPVIPETLPEAQQSVEQPETPTVQPTISTADRLKKIAISRRSIGI